ncbi:MAG: hypothetical protein RRZ65_08130 [Tannerellaceae bacterium]
MKFIYKSNLRREHMPEWLKYITDYTLEAANATTDHYFNLFQITIKN